MGGGSADERAASWCRWGAWRLCWLTVHVATGAHTRVLAELLIRVEPAFLHLQGGCDGSTCFTGLS